MEKKKSVGIWVRVSVEDKEHGDSPQHHEMRGRLYAEARGWEVTEIYMLEALSGKSVMNYPQTKRMLEDIRKGKITGLIFSKLARLARNTKELLEFADIFKAEDADLVSLQEAIDTSTPAGRLFYTMIAAMAQWEREEIVERVAASVPIRAKLGKPLGGDASFGYRWVGEKGTKQMIIDETEAPARQLMYQLFKEHKRKTTVSKILNEKGYRTRNGSKFSDTTVGRLLRDPIAKGERRANYTKSLGENKKWVIKPESEWVIIPCPAIVSTDLWDECNSILDQQEKKHKKPAKKAVHLFTGIVHCETCDTKMYVPSESKKYICLNCRKNRIDINDLEEIYYEHLKTFLLTDEHLESFISKADKTIEQKENQIKNLFEQKQKIETEMDKLMSLFMSGEVPKEGFGKYYNPLNEQVKQIENTLPELQSEIDFLKIELLNSDQLLYDAQSLYDRWPKLTGESKREIVEQITNKVLISKEQITIKFLYTPTLPYPNKIAVDSQRNLIHALPFSRTGNRVKKPFGTGFKRNPVTIGEHIRKKRMELRLFQKDVAKVIGVSTDCITFWENGRSIPQIHFMPKIISFLGYNPQQIVGDNLGSKIKGYRLKKGLSHHGLGSILGVDASTVGSWERDEFVPKQRTLNNLHELLGIRISKRFMLGKTFH
jgi:site-specific DNA recombinase